MNFKNKKISWIQLGLWVIPFVWTTLILAPLGVMLSVFIENKDLNTYVWLALLLIFPLIALKEIVDRVKHIWTYFLFSVVVVFLSFIVFNSWSMTAIIVFVALLRMVTRLNKGKSFMDTPHWAGVFVIILPFVYSGYTKSPYFQLMSLCFGAIILSLTYFYSGLLRLSDYLSINDSMYNFPKKRISKSSGLVFSLSFVTILLVSIFTLINTFSFVEINPNKAIGSYVPEYENTKDQVQTMEIPEWMSGENNEPLINLAWLGDVLMYCALAFIVYLIGFSIVKLVKNFSQNIRVSEKNDIIEAITEADNEEKINKIANKISLFDFSPNAVVRKAYRKKVLGRKKTKPKPVAKSHRN